MPRCRDIYLKIERMPGHSPLASDDAEKNLFRRDCMFNHGHEDGISTLALRFRTPRR